MLFAHKLAHKFNTQTSRILSNHILLLLLSAEFAVTNLKTMTFPTET